MFKIPFPCYFQTIPSRWATFLSASLSHQLEEMNTQDEKLEETAQENKVCHMTSSYIKFQAHNKHHKNFFLFLMQKNGYCIGARLRWNVMLFCLFQMPDCESEEKHTTDHESIKCMDLSWKIETIVYTESFFFCLQTDKTTHQLWNMNLVWYCNVFPRCIIITKIHLVMTTTTKKLLSSSCQG